MRYLDMDTAKKVSAIGLGTWQFGSREWGYGDAYANETATAITHRALDLGITLFDTAEIYAFGASERILGKALPRGERTRSSRPRCSLCCQSRRLYSNAAWRAPIAL